MQRSYLAIWLAVCLYVVLLPRARAEPLRVDQSVERLRVDGSLREWQGARFTSLGSGEDAALSFALATTDGQGLFLAVEVSDERLVRHAGVGARQDALVLTLAMPARHGGLSAVDVWLHPGEPGRSKARAGIAPFGKPPRPASEIQIVEGPQHDGVGYVIEAYLPFRLIPGSEIWQQGRAALRFEDVDSERSPRPEAVLSTEVVTTIAALPRLLSAAGHGDLLDSFLSSQGLAGTEPRYDFRVQVAGDAVPERVVVVDRFVVVLGPRYKQGKGFSALSLPFGTDGNLKRCAVVKVTGDGLDELTCLIRQRNELGLRELWLAISFREEEPRILFGIELRKETRGGFIENTLQVDANKGRAALLRVSRGGSAGLDEANYRESRSSDMEPILLPWDEVSSRTYQFDGQRLVTVAEKRNPKKPKAVPARPTEPSVVTDAPSVPSIEAVLTLFKKERGLPASAAPSWHVRADLVGSKALEEVFAFKTQLVIVGPDVGEGASYFAYGLPITDPSDLRHLGVEDVTGDGKAELFIRVRQVLGGAPGVMRGVMLVHRFDEQQRFSRVLSLEAFRYQAQSRIANRVSTARGRLVVSPGVAVGFSENHYPFVDEPVAGAGRLLLPWKDSPASYRLREGVLVPE